ncbi:transcription factor bHLH95-like [Oryza brachyantha]|uniref:transcription factor bHLH95-like n=1 Tax=Oryza brachyantha TaxID=4533 RepID=UPI001ADAB632|nr:transcription factor bHLH95-like [Oryza brachyantha]
MSREEGANLLPREADESPGHADAFTAGVSPVRSIKTEKSNSSSSSGDPGEINSGLEVASPPVIGVSTRIKGAGKNSAAVKREEGGGCAGVRNGVGRRGSNGKGKSALDMEHALHIWTERERRKKMKNMFSTLHALLPKIPGKADKATIVGEAIGYIRTLEDVVLKLEGLKMERMRAQHWASSAAAAAAATVAGEGSSQAPRHAAATATAPAVNTQQQQAAVTVAAAGPAPALQTWSAPNITLTMAGVDAFINMCLPRQKASFTTVAFVLEKHQIDVVTSTMSADQDKSLFSVHVRLNEASLQSPEGLTPEAKYKLAVSELMVRLAE